MKKGRKEGRNEAVQEDEIRSQPGRSQRGVPAEDDLHLGPVQFPSVGQSHDALLVVHQADGVHVLPETKHPLISPLYLAQSS